MNSATDQTTLHALAAGVLASRGLAHKRDIAAVMARLRPAASDTDASRLAVPLGDDCAALVDGDGFLLLAMEGFVSDFVAAEPRFAGYCGVMVNVSDIYAMGGRPLAVVDALWCRDNDSAAPLLEGLIDAADVYGVPLVGGHSNLRAHDAQLSVAILGRAKRLLSSFAARPGQCLVAAIDLRGAFHEPFPYWDASSGAPAARLRADLDILPTLAEAGLCGAAKDISMAGIIGTALMFAECSRCGMLIDVDAIPRPPEVPLARWLDVFPSYGFLLSLDRSALPSVLRAFAERDLAAAVIGEIDASGTVRVRGAHAGEVPVWDFAQAALIGCAPVEDRSLCQK